MKENPYELLYMSRCGDDWSLRALFVLFEPGLKAGVNSMILRYRPLEIYREDLLQEARIVLIKAIDSYREDMQCSFKTFLSVLSERRIYSVLRHYSAASYAQMHDMVYLEDHVCENGTIYDVLPLADRMSDPRYHLQYTEAMERLCTLYAEMKPTEKQVLAEYVQGHSYQESCDRLAMSYKTYDGRLQRVKKKIRAAVNS